MPRTKNVKGLAIAKCLPILQHNIKYRDKWLSGETLLRTMQRYFPKFQVIGGITREQLNNTLSRRGVSIFAGGITEQFSSTNTTILPKLAAPVLLSHQMICSHCYQVTTNSYLHEKHVLQGREGR